MVRVSYNMARRPCAIPKIRNRILSECRFILSPLLLLLYFKHRRTEYAANTPLYGLDDIPLANMFTTTTQYLKSNNQPINRHLSRHYSISHITILASFPIICLHLNSTHCYQKLLYSTHLSVSSVYSLPGPIR